MSVLHRWVFTNIQSIGLIYMWHSAGLTLAGVSLAVSEPDQRCLSCEELGTHSQKVCMGQTDRATSVGVCSSHMCTQACKHMGTNTCMHSPLHIPHRRVFIWIWKKCCGQTLALTLSSISHNCQELLRTPTKRDRSWHIYSTSILMVLVDSIVCDKPKASLWKLYKI